MEMALQKGCPHGDTTFLLMMAKNGHQNSTHITKDLLRLWKRLRGDTIV